MLVNHFIGGAVIKFVASTDDMFSRLPVITAAAKTRTGKIAFAVGNILALVVVMVISSLLAPVVSSFPQYRYVVAGVILLMAVFIVTRVPEKKQVAAERRLLSRYQRQISLQRVFALVLIGFATSLLTLIDDAVVFIPLFDSGFVPTLFAAAGILLVTIVQLIVLVLLADRLHEIPHQRYMVGAALAAYAVAVGLGFL